MGIILIIGIILAGFWAERKPKRRGTTNAARAAAERAAQAKAAEKAAHAAAKAAAIERKAAERRAALAEKQAAERIQAKEDIPYYQNQLARFYEMIAAAKAELKAARDRCRLDSEMNRYAAAIPEKLVSKHIAERDKLLNKVIRLENQIHAMEKRLLKAETILND